MADVKVKEQVGEHYYLAYVGEYGGMIKVGDKMTYAEALVMLGVSGVANNTIKVVQYDKGSSSFAQRALEHLGSGHWGIYSDSQVAAKALAVTFGYTSPPEVHGSGMYGHYHDSTHTFHIWFGGVLTY